jgi:hypothetical protein
MEMSAVQLMRPSQKRLLVLFLAAYGVFAASLVACLLM